MIKNIRRWWLLFLFFFKKSTESQSTSSESSQRNASGSTQHQTLELTVNKSQVSIAEIRWLLQTVTIGHSNNLNNNITELFKVVSWAVTLGADKTRYIINHGIAPYFYEILNTNVNLADFHVISFDESMNSITQTNQMGCLIRYWDSEANLVKVWFWNSSYLVDYGTHKDVLEKLENSLTGLKGYLHYKTITSQNRPSNTQVKNFLCFIEKLRSILKIFKFLYFY